MLYDECRVCGRKLKSEKSRRIGAGNTCAVNSFIRGTTEGIQQAAMNIYKKIRLDELKKKAKERADKKKKFGKQ